MNIGNVVITTDINHIFKIVDICENFAYGFDILNDSKFIRMKKDQLIVVTENTILLKKLCKFDQVRLDVAGLFYNTVTEKSAYLGVSDRTVIRIRN